MAPGITTNPRSFTPSTATECQGSVVRRAILSNPDTSSHAIAARYIDRDAASIRGRRTTLGSAGTRRVVSMASPGRTTPRITSAASASFTSNPSKIRSDTRSADHNTRYAPSHHQRRFDDSESSTFSPYARRQTPVPPGLGQPCVSNAAQPVSDLLRQLLVHSQEGPLPRSDLLVAATSYSNRYSVTFSVFTCRGSKRQPLP